MPNDAVIYARYSSDLQREASIHDQTTACRVYAAKCGWNVVRCYDDPAVSGASVANRPGVQRLMADAKAKRFSVVIVHAIDRLGRRLADLADIYDQLGFLGIKLCTPEMGEITHMHIAVFGMMAQARLRETGSATKAGQFGRVEAGKIPSGIAYGYRALPGKVVGKILERGEREIVPAEAGIVRRIFEEYADGKTPEAIAKGLNAEGVPGPTGGAWLNTTIRGQVVRGTGILNNALYVGRLEWNRCSYVKNLRTGKRDPRPNPPEEWGLAEVEHLRIIDDALWIRVRVRQQEIAARRTAIEAAGGNRLNGARRAQFVLSGKLRCGCCGHDFIIIDKHRLGCSRVRSAGTCANDHKIKRRDLEARVLVGIKHGLINARYLSLFKEKVEAEVASATRDQTGDRDRLQRDLAKTEKKIGNLVTAIAEGVAFEALKEGLAKLEGEQAAIRAALAETIVEAPQIDLPSDWEATHRAAVEQLEALLEDPKLRDAAIMTIQSLIEEIVLTPREDGSGLKIELEGALAGLLALSAGPKAGRPRSGDRGRQLSVVAGARFELTTFRL